MIQISYLFYSLSHKSLSSMKFIDFISRYSPTFPYTIPVTSTEFSSFFSIFIYGVPPPQFLLYITSTISPWLLSHMSIPFPNTSALIVYIPSSSPTISAVGRRSNTESTSFPEYLNFTF